VANVDKERMELQAVTREASIDLLARVLGDEDTANATAIYDNIFSLGFSFGRLAQMIEETG
jgi:hypothetical protein